MTSLTNLSKRERILGGLWGSLVGDALGVPVEFKDRATVRVDPVTDMRGYGTHNQHPGTWSDDSSLLLCSVDSLVRHEFDTQDMGRSFVLWCQEELWTPHGKVFDIGSATAHALNYIVGGMRAEMAGGVDERSNGNGSLMRIIPVSLRFADSPTKQLLDRVHRASAITHRHPRSQMACGFFTLVARELLNGYGPSEAFAKAMGAFRLFYEPDPWWAVELDCFQFLLAGDLPQRPESEIDSGGYVLHTLPASLWCLLTTSSFEECVLKAVNLGGDTDTTGCVAGGLAGVHYGVNAIPEKWIQALARRTDVEALFNDFTRLTESKQ
jgi:ADP-ribosylglycohydrolase